MAQDTLIDCDLTLNEIEESSKRILKGKKKNNVINELKKINIKKYISFNDKLSINENFDLREVNEIINKIEYIKSLENDDDDKKKKSNEKMIGILNELRFYCGLKDYSFIINLPFIGTKTIKNNELFKINKKEGFSKYLINELKNGINNFEKNNKNISKKEKLIIEKVRKVIEHNKDILNDISSKKILKKDKRGNIIKSNSEYPIFVKFFGPYIKSWL